MLRGEAEPRLGRPLALRRAPAKAAFGRPTAIAAVVAIALLVRVPFLSHETWDYTNYVSRWYDAIDRQPGFGWLSGTFSNYTPPYLYALWLATTVPLPKLLAVKLVSIVFDFLLAGAAALVVRGIRPGWLPAFAAFAGVLLAPSVVLNSSAWGQCDAVYTAFVVAAVALLVRGRPAWAMLAVGAALAIKLQAVFMLPVFAILTLRQPKLLPSWLLLPLPYALAILPPWLAGRSLPSLLGIYHDQADTYNALTLNAPSVYAFVDARQGWGPYGVLFALVAVGVVCLVVWRLPVRLTPAATLLLALVFNTLAPFLLPHMHERYFFAADVLAVAYAVTRPARWFVPVLVITASTLSYWPFLFSREVLPLEVLAGLMAAALLAMFYDLVQSTRDDRHSTICSRSSTADATAAVALPLDTV